MLQIDDLKEVFELAKNASIFVKELIQLKNNNKNEINASSGDYSQLASSGDASQLASSGNSSQLASSGDYSQLASSGDSSQLASSGDYSQLASSGDASQLASSGDSSQLASSGNYSPLASSGDSSQLASSGNYSPLASSGDSSQLASSGNYSPLASSGDYSQLASSGNYSPLASSGDYSQLASSGDSSQLASSGDYSQLASSGDSSIVCSIGYNSVAKATKNSWITLSEFDNRKVKLVKTEFVDGEKIKYNTYYGLYKGKFREFIEIDEIKSLIINKKQNIIKVKNFNDNFESYIIESEGAYSHGKTIKDARENLIYKTSNRDTSKYNNYKLDTKLTKKEAIELYRVITGACESGVKYFVQNSGVKKRFCTVEELIKITNGQFGNDILKKFFNKD